MKTFEFQETGCIPKDIREYATKRMFIVPSTGKATQLTEGDTVEMKFYNWLLLIDAYRDGEKLWVCGENGRRDNNDMWSLCSGPQPAHPPPGENWRELFVTRAKEVIRLIGAWVGFSPQVLREDENSITFVFIELIG